jgi:hypothetical protein
MTASDWAAWVGALTGVLALSWEILKWTREGARLHLQTSPTMRLAPDHDERPILMVWVTNTGSATTTLTSFALVTFHSTWDRWRFKTGKNWVVLENVVGPPLPRELAPGQQWLGGLRQDNELASVVASGKLFSAIYHTRSPKRPALGRVTPPSPRPVTDQQ